MKKSFEIPGTIGLIGGRPNQAHYFIGYVGDEALYLDPHTTQKCGSVKEKLNGSEMEMDETYHQKYAARINFEKMDPSLALCFLCKTRTEFDELCTRLKSDIISTGSQPLFEITETSQTPWQACPTTTTKIPKTSQSTHFPRTDETAISDGNFFKIKIRGLYKFRSCGMRTKSLSYLAPLIPMDGFGYV